jgi:hypothetical protein
MLRAWRVNEIDEQLCQVQRRLWNLMERLQPYMGEWLRACGGIEAVDGQVGRALGWGAALS